MEQRVQREGEPEGATSWPEVVAITLLRLLVISCFVVILAFLLPGDSVAYYAFIAFAYIAAIPYALWLKRRVHSKRILPLQFVVDLLWVTALVYFTGGIESDLSLLYPLVILSAGIVAGPVRAAQITVLSILAYVLLVVLMAQGVLVPLNAGDEVMNWSLVGQAVALRIFVFMCFGAASAYVSQRCRYADRKVDQVRRVSEIIFRNLRAGLMLLDDEKKVLMVNEMACSLLAQQEKDLVGRPLEDLLDEGRHVDPTEADGDATPCYFKRPGGETFPASFEMSRVTLPAEALPGLPGKNGADVLIMVFNDISRMMEMREKAEHAARLQSAVKLVSEIAHEVRNPLAAISGSLQVLRKLEKDAVNGKQSSMDFLEKERPEMYDRVIAEAGRLDEILEKFVNHAEFSPEALDRLVDEDEKQLQEPVADESVAPQDS